MKTLFLSLSIAFNFCIFSQEDPNKFFPSSVGNVWEYLTSQGIFRSEIIKDSIDSKGFRYLFYYPDQPYYKLDSSYSVFYVPYYLNWLYYKLNADSADIWTVDQRVEEDTTYMLALVRNKYASMYLGRSTTIMEITFYDYQPDTIINEFSWPRFTVYLAYGMGEIMYFDEEGGGPQRILLGCIINGDTIGTITKAIKDDKTTPLSFELFQNYPNPFNSTTTIRFSIEKPQKIKLTVYSILGEEISVLVDEYKASGFYSVTFNSIDLPSGVYIYALTGANSFLTKKIILLK